MSRALPRFIYGYDPLLGFENESGSQWSPGQLDKAYAQVYTVADGEILTVEEQQL